MDARQGSHARHRELLEPIQAPVVGQHHQVSVKHLHRYLDEFAFKFNNREAENIFAMIVLNLDRRALRYKTLTGPVSASPAESERFRFGVTGFGRVPISLPRIASNSRFGTFILGSE